LDGRDPERAELYRQHSARVHVLEAPHAHPATPQKDQEGARRLREAGTIPLCDLKNRKELEQTMFLKWQNQSTMQLSTLVTGKSNNNRSHGDHTDHDDNIS